MFKEEQELFWNADHVFPTNDLSDSESKESLSLLRGPKSRIRATHNISGFNNIGPYRARGLEPKLTLAVGARVSVNNNIWTSVGFPAGAK